jgi:hypothetical protein
MEYRLHFCFSAVARSAPITYARTVPTIPTPPLAIRHRRNHGHILQPQVHRSVPADRAAALRNLIAPSREFRYSKTWGKCQLHVPRPSMLHYTTRNHDLLPSVPPAECHDKFHLHWFGLEMFIASDFQTSPSLFTLILFRALEALSRRIASYLSITSKLLEFGALLLLVMFMSRYFTSWPFLVVRFALASVAAFLPEARKRLIVNESHRPWKYKP